MNLENLWLLSWQNVTRNRKRLLLSSLGIVFGIATLVFFFALTSGARSIIFDHFLKRLPANQVRLAPDYKSNVVGWLIDPQQRDRPDRQETVNQDRIEPKKVEFIRGLEGVDSIIGQTMVETDCVLYAFSVDNAAHTRIGFSSYPSEFYAEDIPENVDWSFREGEVVPLLINPQLMLAWNEIFSSSYNYPKADVETISSIPLYITVRNQQTGLRDSFEARIVGLSSKANLFAPLAPPGFVMEMNRRSFGEDFQPLYSSIVVQLESPAYVDDLIARASKIELAASGDKQVAEMIDMAITVITLFLGAISLIIVIISLINIFNIFLINVMERQFEIGIMRAVGASKSNIRWMVLLESAVVGFVTGLVGVLLALIIIFAVEPFLAPFLEQFVGAGATFFVIDPLFLIAVVFASPLVNMLAVFQPANYAAGLDPVQALRR